MTNRYEPRWWVSAAGGVLTLRDAYTDELLKIDPKQAAIVRQLCTWPLSLTANGMWHAFPDSSLARGWDLGMVTASDVTLLSYDALLLSRARRAGAGLAAAESFIGTLLLGFGVVTALRADPRDRALVWSMTAIPAALGTHGVLSLALPRGRIASLAVAPQYRLNSLGGRGLGSLRCRAA